MKKDRVRTENDDTSNMEAVRNLHPGSASGSLLQHPTNYASAGKCTLPSALLKVICFVEQPCRRKVAFAS